MSYIGITVDPLYFAMAVLMGLLLSTLFGDWFLVLMIKIEDYFRFRELDAVVKEIHRKKGIK